MNFRIDLSSGTLAIAAAAAGILALAMDAVNLTLSSEMVAVAAAFFLLSGCIFLFGRWRAAAAAEAKQKKKRRRRTPRESGARESGARESED